MEVLAVDGALGADGVDTLLFAMKAKFLMPWSYDGGNVTVRQKADREQARFFLMGLARGTCEGVMKEKRGVVGIIKYLNFFASLAPSRFEKALSRK